MLGTGGHGSSGSSGSSGGGAVVVVVVVDLVLDEVLETGGLKQAVARGAEQRACGFVVDERQPPEARRYRPPRHP